MKFALVATTGLAISGCLLYSMPPAFAGQKSSVAQTTPELVVQVPQSGDVNAFTFSPDGHVLAVSSQDGIVRMVDIATGSILLRVPVEGANPGSFCYSPDGKLFATSALNDAIVLRDSKTGAVTYRLEGHSQTCFAFSPTSGLIAAGTAEDNIALIDYYTGNVVRTIRSHSGWLNVLRFSEDGEMLACSGGSMAEKAGAEIFTVKTGSLVKHIDLKEGATAFAFSRDSRTLALGSGRLLSGGPGVALFDIRAGTIARTMQGREFEATALQFTKDGTTAVLGAAENDHYEVVKCLLDAGADVKDEFGHSLLSARANRRALGAALLSVLNSAFGPHLNHAPDAEKTGAYYFDVEGTALMLLYLGAPGNITNIRGGSLIAHTQSERLVRKLVAAGADINDFHSSGESALMFWITQNNIPLVKLAHELGADVNKADKSRYTPLMTAAGGGKEEIVYLLLGWNANVNAIDDNGENALLHAVSGGYPNIVRILAERGAKLELKDRYYHLTAIAHAVRDGDLEMTKILIDHRASMKDTGADLMELAAEADQRDHFGMTELLKTYRAQTK